MQEFPSLSPNWLMGKTLRLSYTRKLKNFALNCQHQGTSVVFQKLSVNKSNICCLSIWQKFILAINKPVQRLLLKLSFYPFYHWNTKHIAATSCIHIYMIFSQYQWSWSFSGANSCRLVNWWGEYHFWLVLSIG